MPDHLVPMHRPRATAAASRYQRTPSLGPYRPSGRCASRRKAARAASRRLESNRSATIRASATTAQNMTKLSSRPVRACTIPTPSTAKSPPATTPARVEENSRRAARASRNTAITPTTAVASRHAHGFCEPPTRSPSAIIHLPIGGWTT